MLSGVTSQDPVTSVISSAVLTGAAFVAALVPAWRAARVDPLVAIRYKKHQPAREPSEYVFPSRTRKGPIQEVQKAVQRLRKRCGFKFVTHDLVGPPRR
jgi:hypothetical protein